MGLVADHNAGFKGTVDSSQTPVVLGKGALYSVIGPGDLLAKAGGSGDRAVTVAPGAAWGDGVLSTWQTGAVLNAAAATGTTRRWDTLVIRRAWTPTTDPTGTATLVLLTGGTSRAVSTARKTDRGVTVSDQPLALVGVDPGSTSVEVAPIRCWSGDGGGLICEDAAARDYLTTAGTIARCPDGLWACTATASGTTVWGRVLVTESDLADGAVTIGKLATAATASTATASTLVKRTAAGLFDVATPTSAAHPATKAYVDAADASATATIKTLRATRVEATMTGVSIAASSTIGVTTAVAVNAVAYARVLHISYQVMCAAVTGWVDFAVRNNSVALKRSRVAAPDTSVGGEFTIALPANTAASLQLVGITGAGQAATIPNDPNFTWLHVTALTV